MAAPPAVMAARSQPKGWLATLVILLIMLGIVVGGFFAAAAVASIPDKPIEVARGVIVTVPSEWEYQGRFDEGAILLSRGRGNVAIMVKDATDERAELAKLRDEWVALGTVTAGEISEVADLRAGQPAARFAYSGTFPDEGIASPVEGEVTVVRGTASVVLFDAWAGFGEFVEVSPEVTSIIRETTIP